MKAALLALVLLCGCAAKPVVVMPVEEVDLALHCRKTKAQADGCVVEESDAVKVYVLTRKAMCGS